MTTRRIDELLHLFNEKAPISRTFGMTLSFDGEARATVDLPYNPGLDHPLDGVHGGVYATLLDTAGWYTAAAAYEETCWLATSEMSIHFLAPVQHSRLRAVGRLIRCGKRQTVAEMHLYDAEGRLVGHATGTFMVLPNVSMLVTP
jgi:uncharacterized protein (TIGR00369 family)